MAEMVLSRQFAAGDEIFRMGDFGRNAYIIERGRVEVSASVDGEKLVIAELGQGEIFGEMSMIDDAPRSATVIAAEDTEVIVIQRSRFQRPLSVADPLMNLLLRVVLSRFRDSQRQFSRKTAELAEIDPALEEIRQLALGRIKVEKDMRQGLDAEEFELHYQPIVSLESGRIAGYEALMRWRKKDGGFVSPMDFIPLAEETGIIIDLGQLALQRAIEDQFKFADRFGAVFPDLPPAFMSVNVSGLQLSELSDVDGLATIIEQSGVDPALIKLEMTETLLVEDPDHAARALEKLKGLGVSIAIDDFGTGYSSLSYLHQYPLDTLKIDRSFVNNMDKSETGRRIVGSIVQLALALEMNIVAEGIEEKAQMDALRDLGCQYGQGYYMAKPASAEQTIELIDSRPGW
ncbi:MAG: EAL domain-containing protein [Alphaproteobacteria bacterium]|jgi:EAL domain-containing protein (putative c-di-GMP-specific phosphodiesterase class I)|nr:EAL domain-containing protein [Alphaproteobacteria bacterium]MDP6815528.1 EAL domain-containing protein [Alphaproteobacteria bacterium]